MKITLWVLIIGLTAFLLVSIVGGALNRAREMSEGRARSHALGGSIITVTHDGHMFVLFAGNGAGICHHPECKKCAGKE